MKIGTCVFARGGSKGLPNKNIRSFEGKPLIAWAIEQALDLEHVDEVFVSTDSEEIANIARDYGAIVPFLRPAELSTDESPEWLAWRHFLDFLNARDGQLPNVLLSVPTTAPLRFTSDIQRCIDLFEPGTTDAVVTITDAHRNPFFNMVSLADEGFVSIVAKSPFANTRRQDSPKVFDMTTVAYVVDTKFVMEQLGLFEGRVKAVHIPADRAIDIDNLLDFEVAEFLLRRRKSPNE
jgi:N-acylneuraminate cytidylyltransferase